MEYSKTQSAKRPKKTKRKNKKSSRTKLPKLMLISKLDAFVWKITSLAFRIQDADENGYVNCCTCGKRMYYYKSDAQLGHFQSRRFKHTKFVRENLAPQDTSCNKYRFGEQFKMGMYINKRFGKGTAESLIEDSKNFNKFTRYDYKKVLLENSKILLKEAEKKNLWEWKTGMTKWQLNFLEKVNYLQPDMDLKLGTKRSG